MSSLKGWLLLLLVLLVGVGAVAVYQGWLPLLSSPAEENGTCPPPLSACDVARVVEVVDGDTIKVTLHKKEEQVRLIGVDTPETKHPSKPVECFGPEASRFTSSTLGN
jgi:endonuclease YncB( thermonuclease family)